jgi:hypothetical protein
MQRPLQNVKRVPKCRLDPWCDIKWRFYDRTVHKHLAEDGSHEGAAATKVIGENKQL